jgi:hypothetical protein
MGAGVTHAATMVDRTTRSLALGGLLLVLLMRVLVPSGWMPVAAPNGGFAVTLCVDGGAVSAWIDADGRLHRTAKADGPSKDMPGKDAPCAFAATGLPPLPALTIEVAARLTRVVAAPLRPGTVVAIGRGLAAPPPPATGPPARR